MVDAVVEVRVWILQGGEEALPKVWWFDRLASSSPLAWFEFMGP